MLLQSGNPFKCHEEVLSLQPMVSPKRFVAAWVCDGIISSGVNRWDRNVHCIVGVLESVTTRYDSVITRKGEGGRSVIVNGPQRPLGSLLRETNYASLTTKCSIMPGICTVPDTSPRPSAFHDSSSVRQDHGDQVKSTRLDNTAATELSIIVS